MTAIYEHHFGGLSPYVDNGLKFLLCVRKSSHGEPVAVLVRGDGAASDELRDILVIGDHPVEIEVLARGDMVKVLITRLSNTTRDEWVSEL